MTISSLDVLERGYPISFSFEEMMKYHGPGSPGGVANAFKVLQRALPLLDPDGAVERREISVRTAFGGPGARDGVELVTRAVTGDRFAVDRALARPQLGITRERFVFELGYRGRAVTLVLREGFVTEEFIRLARTDGLSDVESERLETLKRELAERVMAADAAEVYDAEVG
jgi:hypothetical protein